MRIFISWLLNLGIWNVLTNIQNKQVSWTESKVIVFQWIPFSTHDWVTVFLRLFAIQKCWLIFNVLFSLFERVSIVTVYHFSCIPQRVRTVFHTTENNTMWKCVLFLSERIPSQTTERNIIKRVTDYIKIFRSIGKIQW